MDYPAFAEVHCPEVSLNRLPVRYYIPAKIIAQTCGKLQLQLLHPASNHCSGWSRGTSATFRTFLFPATDTYHKELVNSLLRSCHYHDTKPELLLTSFLQHPYRDYRLSSIQRIYYIHRHKQPRSTGGACFTPFEITFANVTFAARN